MTAAEPVDGEPGGGARKRVLMIANDFPPVGGAGVQRSVYFARYLRDFGWDPVVLTVRDVAFPAKDPSLLEELPADLSVVRTGSLELRRVLWHLRRVAGSGRSTSAPRVRGDKSASDGLQPLVREAARSLRRWMFVPDDRILWAPFALAAALRIIRRCRVDAVYATTPCYSAAVIGQLVSRLADVPLVVDLRDPWSRDPYLPSATRLHAWINKRFERRALSRASRVVVISERMRSVFRAAYPEFPDEKFVVITNGFDAEQMAGAEPIGRGGEFVVAYVGSLYAHHVPAFTAFCESWLRRAAEDPDFAEQARLWIVGRCDPEIEAVLATRSRVRVTRFGYRAHREALRYLKGASGLLLLIRALDPEKDVITIPGKLFEYLAAGKPILMIGPEGDAAEIVRHTGGSVHFESDVEGVADTLGRLFRAPERATDEVGAVSERGRYERRNLTQRLAAELDASLEPS